METVLTIVASIMTLIIAIAATRINWMIKENQQQQTEVLRGNQTHDNIEDILIKLKSDKSKEEHKAACIKLIVIARTDPNMTKKCLEILYKFLLRQGNYNREVGGVIDSIFEIYSDAYKRKRKIEKRTMRIPKAHLTRVHLANMQIEPIKCPGFDFSQKDLSGTNLKEADLRNVNFERANLVKAKLKGAKLKGANLKDANLTNAYLLDVEGLTAKQILSAYWETRTKLTHRHSGAEMESGPPINIPEKLRKNKKVKKWLETPQNGKKEELAKKDRDDYNNFKAENY